MSLGHHGTGVSSLNATQAGFKLSLALTGNESQPMTHKTFTVASTPVNSGSHYADLEESPQGGCHGTIHFKYPV